MKKEFLNLGKQPIANGFLYKEEIKDEFFFELIVGCDEETKLVTQMEYVDPSLMFNETYAYRGSMSITMKEHFKSFSESLQLRLPQFPFYKKNPRVLEIGSNDGVFIKNWDYKNTFAVEPCGNFAEETNKMGYKTYSSFWDNNLSTLILENEGPMDLIFAANCMCHIPNIDETFSAIKNLLSDGGVFIFEDPSLAEMINNNSYDQIYDEHPHIFSVIALKNILERNGLTIIEVTNLPVHGGSNRIWVQKTKDIKNIDPSVEYNLQHERILGLDKFETFERFATRVSQSKEDLIRILKQCKEEGKKVISYGATSKSTTIFNYCGIDKELISYITDTTPEKQEKLCPGMHIPIISPQKGFNKSVDYAYLGAWNFIKEISNKEKDFLKRGGKFITHVPIVKFV